MLYIVLSMSYMLRLKKQPSRKNKTTNKWKNDIKIPWTKGAVNLKDTSMIVFVL